MSDKRYTAQEMREAASNCENVVKAACQFYSTDMDRAAAMLHQAADIIERCEELLAKYNNMPCKECADGEVEPDCPYLGEPCGCNSPTYGKFYDERIGDLNYILRGDAEEGVKE